MTWGAARAVARALLFEGYLLYPYRQSGLKNQKRWAFGTLYPATAASVSGERSALRAEVLVRGRAPSIRAAASFLQWCERTDAEREPWLEGIERFVETRSESIASLGDDRRDFRFSFEPDAWQDGVARYRTSSVEGVVEMRALRLGEALYKLAVSVTNATVTRAPTADGDDARATELHTLVSAHLLLACEGGEFVSLLEPPDELLPMVEGCKSEGVFPVLVGDAGRRDLMLASPIHVYDHPAVAPESHGDFYDATEMDEMLTLRIKTLTDDEKLEARRTDPRAAALIDRAESTSHADLLALHGARRDPLAHRDANGENGRSPATSAAPRPGERVRLRPRSGRDLFDLALDGEIATVVSHEEDFEGRRYCTVTIDADPGRDLGVSGQPGHRFFFDLDELEPLS